MNTIQHMRRIICICLIFLILILGAGLISCEDAGTASSSSSQGSSTGPVYVSSQADLEAMADDLSETYVLKNDITITTDNWTALGTSADDPTTGTPFSGQLDGNGKIISIEAASTAGTVAWDGLFYQLTASNEGDVVVKDLNIRTVGAMKFNSSNTGVLAKTFTQGVVENIKLYGMVGISSTANIDIPVEADTSNLGGLIGQIITSNKVELKNISANINMTKTNTKNITNAGGLVGYVVNVNALLDSIIVKGTVSLPYSGTNTSDNIGGIVGYTKGTISQAMSSVNVSGGKYVGALVGRADTSTFTNVYASGTASGDTFVGGLIGYTSAATINFAIALGKVTGQSGTDGFIGNFTNSTASNAFFDLETTGRGASTLGMGMSTANMKKASTFANFDNLNFWIIKDGSYPKLYLEDPTYLRLLKSNYAEIMGNVFEFEFSEPVSITATSFTLNSNAIPTSAVTTSGNTVSVTTSPSETAENTFAFNVASSTEASETLASSYKFYFYHNKDNDEYYDVSTCAGLQGMNNLLSTKFELVQDIDCEDSKNWNGAAGFNPIGSGTNKFTGTLLGNGFKISKLYINRSSTDYVGLIGYNSGTIESLGLVDATITGKTNVGILAGTNEGTIKKVSTSGTVTGSGRVGGVLGYHNTSTLSLAYSTSTVSGGAAVGGLVGYNNASISDSYAAGKVTGTVTNGNIGGLVGWYQTGSVVRSYFDKEVSTQSEDSSQGNQGEGKTTAEMKTAATYVGWDTSVWNLVDGAYPAFK